MKKIMLSACVTIVIALASKAGNLTLKIICGRL